MDVQIKEYLMTNSIYHRKAKLIYHSKIKQYINHLNIKKEKNV